MAGYPKFRKGQRQVAADDMSFLVAKVRRIAATAVKEVLNSELSKIGKPRERTVLVTDLLMDRLQVQPVRYEATPPQECSGTGDSKECHYELSTETLEAFPDFGWSVSDYAQDKFNVGDDKLDDTASFLRMYFEHGTWRLQKPKAGATATILGMIVSIPEPGGQTLMIQELSFADGPIEPDPIGDPIEVFVWPGTTSNDYLALSVAGAVVPPVIKIEQYGGLWFARQMFPAYMHEPDIRYPRADCS